MLFDDPRVREAGVGRESRGVQGTLGVMTGESEHTVFAHTAFTAGVTKPYFRNTLALDAARCAHVEPIKRCATIPPPSPRQRLPCHSRRAGRAHGPVCTLPEHVHSRLTTAYGKTCHFALWGCLRLALAPRRLSY